MKIANIDLGERPVMLAPMEDVTDLISGFNAGKWALRWSILSLYRQKP